MRWMRADYVIALAALFFLLLTTWGHAKGNEDDSLTVTEARHRANPLLASVAERIDRGQRIFRYDAFGSNLFFSEELHLNETLENLPPSTALALGLKVDFDALNRGVRQALRKGVVDLDDPAVTAELLRRSAVVGVVANVNDDGSIEDVGITCALCHSTVDDRIAPGVGSRLDGWANRDLDVGSIIAAAPTVQPIADLLGLDQDTVRSVLRSWGPGRFDAHLNLDGKAFRPDGKSASVLIPPAFGLAGVNMHTYNGWGSVPYWNAFVGNLEMSGAGRFFDPRLRDAERFPVAAANGFGDRDPMPRDLITAKLADLHFYQLALEAPSAPAGRFDPDAAARGALVFEGQGQCARCHVPPLYTEPGWNLHDPEEIGIDSFQADRGPEGKYRTTPLKGLWTHDRGGFYHDGRFPTLESVVDHYDGHLTLGLDAAQKSDLVAFLRSL